MQLERYLENAGNRVPCDVVLRRTEPTGRDDQIDVAECAGQRLRQFVDVVADDTFQADVTADRVEALGDRQRIGIDAKRRQQLAADRDDAGLQDTQATRDRMPQRVRFA